MSGAEQIKPYDRQREKGEQVEQMFDSIAPAYDFMNTAMTFGLHRYWRRRALSLLKSSMHNAEAGKLRMLDVACGTGDVTFSLLRTFPGARVDGLDLSPGMLRVARRRLAKMPEQARKAISFSEGDCLHLPYPDASFDAVTVAYGVRNFADLPAGYSEMLRVLRPGGTLCVIELCEPSGALMRAGYHLYSQHIIPLMGSLVSGDKSAYTYLPRSIAACPQRSAMTELMLNAGFSHADFKILFPGTVGIYIGRKQRP